MSVDDDRDSFRLDSGASSFQLTGFRRRDVPGLFMGLAVLMAGVSSLGLFLQPGPAQIVREPLRVALGTSLGFLAGVWLGGLRGDHRAADPRALPPPSEQVRQIALDPARKIEAIRQYRDETGASLADAKRQVEALGSRQDQ